MLLSESEFCLQGTMLARADSTLLLAVKYLRLCSGLEEEPKNPETETRECFPPTALSWSKGGRLGRLTRSPSDF